MRDGGKSDAAISEIENVDCRDQKALADVAQLLCAAISEIENVDCREVADHFADVRRYFAAISEIENVDCRTMPANRLVFCGSAPQSAKLKTLIAGW